MVAEHLLLLLLCAGVVAPLTHNVERDCASIKLQQAPVPVGSIHDGLSQKDCRGFAFFTMCACCHCGRKTTKSMLVFVYWSLVYSTPKKKKNNGGGGAV